MCKPIFALLVFCCLSHVVFIFPLYVLFFLPLLILVMKHLGYLSSLPQFGILPTYGQDWASSLMLDVLLGGPLPCHAYPPLW